MTQRSTITVEAELESYFAGEMVGDMGLRTSWTTVTDFGAYGVNLGVSPGRTPPEPTGAALAAARAMTRVEETLAELTVEQRAVLAAMFVRHGPFAPPGLRSLGEIAPVVALIERPDRLRELIILSKSKDASRHGATRELRRVTAHARALTRNALESYREAALRRIDRGRAERASRTRRLVAA